ncbi:dystrophin-related protein 2, partial [Lates japonicus]
MKSLAGEGTLIGIPPASPHSLFLPGGQRPVSQQSYIPGPSVLSADNKQPNNWARVIE